MDPEWTHMLTLNIVHKQAQNAIVLIQLHPFTLVLQDFLVPKLLPKHMPLETLKKEHLSAS